MMTAEKAMELAVEMLDAFDALTRKDIAHVILAANRDGYDAGWVAAAEHHGVSTDVYVNSDAEIERLEILCGESEDREPCRRRE